MKRNDSATVTEQSEKPSSDNKESSVKKSDVSALSDFSGSVSSLDVTTKRRKSSKKKSGGSSA